MCCDWYYLAFLQENPVRNGVHELTNGMNGSATVEINDSDEPVKPEQQSTEGRRELALDLRCFMNRAPVTVRWELIWVIHYDDMHI